MMEGAHGERGRERERERVGVCLCVSVAIKQTLKSTQLRSRQLCRPEHLACVTLCNALINRTVRCFSKKKKKKKERKLFFLDETVPNQNSRDGDNVQIPRLSSSAG